MHEVDGLFPELGNLTRHVLVPVIANFTHFFDGLIYKLNGHGTCKIDGVGRRLHAFKFVNRAGTVGVFYKENDEFGDWMGTWNVPSDPVVVLKPDTLPTALSPCPKTRVEKLPEVRKHWEAVSSIIARANEDPTLPGNHENFTHYFDRDRLRYLAIYLSCLAL